MNEPDLDKMEEKTGRYGSIITIPLRMQYAAQIALTSVLTTITGLQPLGGHHEMDTRSYPRTREESLLLR